MTDLRIRRYEPRDADAVWQLHVRALSDAGAYDEEFAHLDADLRRIESAYLETGGEFLVGELDADGGDVADGGSAGEPPLVAMGAFQPYDPDVHARVPLRHHPETDGRDRTTAVLRRMRVDPDYQRRGFGSALLSQLEDRARARGVDRLVLDTTAKQTAAIEFYEAHDYERWYREVSAIEGASFEVLCYEKRLSAG